MKLSGELKKKLIDVGKLCEIIRPGNRIFLSTGPAIPVKSVRYILKTNHGNFDDLEFVQLTTIEDMFAGTEKSSRYRLKIFNVGESIAKGVEKGNVDFIPSNIAEIPYLFVTNAVGVDVAIIQTSPPDEHGFMCLGIVMDIADIVISKAKIVIAEINPNVPVTYGETTVHASMFHYLIESNEKLIEFRRQAYDETIDKIGWNIANLIEDGSTISFHMGRAFDAAVKHLRNKKGLRVLSHVISDWVIDLIESGALALNYNEHHFSAVSASACFGSHDLYRIIDKNPVVRILPLIKSTYQSSISRIAQLVSVINVRRIDLSGDSVVVNSGDLYISGYDGKMNIALAAAQSRKGKVIVALSSVDRNGNSNIVITHLKDIDHIRSIMGCVRYVVTEYGIAKMMGKTIRERALSIIDIAHPDHREQLLASAKEAGLIYRDQIYVKENALNYPFSLETVKTLKDNFEVKFRPIKPSDEDMMRRLFYEFSDEAKFLRYFRPVKIMPHKQMQPYVNIDYIDTISIVGIIGDRESEKIIAEGRYARDSEANAYEMAFTVDEAYQGKGIASFMLDYLISIAKANKIGELFAQTLVENTKMRKVFINARVKPREIISDDEIKFVFNL